MLLHSKRFHQWASRSLSGQAQPGPLLTAMQQQLQEDPAGVLEKLAAAGELAPAVAAWGREPCLPLLDATS